MTKETTPQVEEAKKPTRERILDAALDLFAQKGYGNVYVGQIAETVGIKAPSLYKHFKSKRDIFDALLQELQSRYSVTAQGLHMNGNDAQADGEHFTKVTEEELVNVGVGLFLYFLRDDYVRKFRKMLTIEQFSDPDLGAELTKTYVDDPLVYQTQLFEILISSGTLIQGDAQVMALEFYTPIYMLLTLCDRDPKREKEALKTLAEHFRQFNRIYGRNTK